MVEIIAVTMLVVIMIIVAKGAHKFGYKQGYAAGEEDERKRHKYTKRSFFQFPELKEGEDE